MKEQALALARGTADPVQALNLLRERLSSIDARTIRDDVGPFLERARDADALTTENLAAML